MIKLVVNNLVEIIEEIIEKRKTVLLQFSAGCICNCSLMKPKFRRLSADEVNIKFLVVAA